MKEAVILAQGAYPTHSYPLQLLHTTQLLICTDGAVHNLIDKEPHVIVGDMDSLSTSLQEKYKDRLVVNKCTETNDLTKAVTYAHEQGIRKITILGATGLRDDHTLANISLLGSYALLIDSVRMVTDYGIFYVFADSTRSHTPDGYTTVKIPCTPGLPVSFFALNPTMHLQAKGVAYPVEDVVFDAWWKATLNTCADSSLDLKFTNGPLLVYLPHF